jgi:hypothetical protein
VRDPESAPESSDGEGILPATPPRPAGESQGGVTITLALRTPERLRAGPDLAPRVSPPREAESEWQLPASTAPPSLGQANQGETGQKRKRQGTIGTKKAEKMVIQLL